MDDLGDDAEISAAILIFRGSHLSNQRGLRPFSFWRRVIVVPVGSNVSFVAIDMSARITASHAMCETIDLDNLTPVRQYYSKFHRIY